MMLHTKFTKLEEKLTLCLKQKKTISAAESCTGGALSSRIIDIPGASEYFLGSVVSYTNIIKTRILGVSPKLLEQYGAVSIPVALEMLEGALMQFSSDFAVATTGVAGPTGGTLETPVGTVIIAVGGKNISPKVETFHLSGDRQSIIQQSVECALELLLGLLNETPT